MRACVTDGVLPLGLFFFAAALLATPARAKIPETGFLDRSVTLARTKYKYQVFVPENWTPNKKWPVILFLHGVGESGEDGLAQTDIGIGTAIRMNRSRFPAIVVMPQCRKNVWWIDPPMDDVAMAALAQSEKEFQGDPRRIYLTGLSIGGYGTWHLAAKYPGRFAALAPICGGILRPEEARVHSPQEKKPYTDAAKKIGGNTPVWIFHGAMDDTVPVTESRRMAEAMKALGGEVRYTEYPGVGHDSWDKAYAEPELFTWMLSKTLGSKVLK
ncbi:MAG TPA: alpha/beta hydrolase-fold protein [Candidatus Methylomirabilis sp.]|nr:alpha/beta hydrolase-fold protein [Candidatus Methylomirabilis sp.]